MRLEKGYSKRLLHFFCLVGITLWSAFLIKERVGDHDDPIQHELGIVYEKSTSTIAEYNDEQIQNIKYAAMDYRTPENEDYCNRAKWLDFQSESLCKVLDTIRQSANAAQVLSLQNTLEAFRIQALHAVDNEPILMEGLYRPQFNTLGHSFKNYTPAQFSSIISNMQLWVRHIEVAVMNYIAKKIGIDHYDEVFYEPNISYTYIYPSKTDTFFADLVLGEYQINHKNQIIRLNGSELPLKNGIAPFQVNYDKPGLYPLRFTVETRKIASDSMRVSEKTFYLRVRP